MPTVIRLLVTVMGTLADEMTVEVTYASGNCTVADDRTTTAPDVSNILYFEVL